MYDVFNSISIVSLTMIFRQKYFDGRTRRDRVENRNEEFNRHTSRMVDAFLAWQLDVGGSSLEQAGPPPSVTDESVPGTTSVFAY